MEWSSLLRSCLYREPLSGGSVFIGCWEGGAKIELGHVGPLDGTARPMAGDVFVLQIGGAVYRTDLVARSLYFPAFP